MRTYVAKGEEAEALKVGANWFVVDATNVVLGRLATKVARMLMGKDNPSFTPYLDSGDHVVVINPQAEERILDGARTGIEMAAGQSSNREEEHWVLRARPSRAHKLGFWERGGARSRWRACSCVRVAVSSRSTAGQWSSIFRITR